MRLYSSIVLEVLSNAGWTPNRNVEAQLVFSENKRSFKEASIIYAEFANLLLEFVGKDGCQCVYFDIDESEASKNLRAAIFGYSSYEEISLVDEPDFEESENFKLTEIVEGHLGKPCSRIGFLEDQIGYDIFVTRDGEIYLTHYQEPIFAHKSFADFLNSTILDVK